ncbi:MAG: PIN domain-containing protein [Rhodoferax sp.]|uniref:PIN domain-containing protein n=1 Tax=Rhodoferax sp. TaxID=50421 RepID=UPI0008C1D37E|nr:PIN domain-containing protein [Rhodoferax sp.]MDP2680979.1 PIN domain-containing protein [Rhodoferax sp.]OGB53259.1 MAG: twitching motility protein PilT [Burkholderiales bacterium RIFOXYD12_FULL_59_19]
MRIALDTNVLAYAEGLGDELRCGKAVQLIGLLATQELFLPAQTLGELTRVLIGKAKRTPADTRDAVLGWADSFEVADSTWPAFQAAFDLVTDHQLPMWDALILAIAAENHCRLLLSEDFNQGFTWRGVTVVNPFGASQHPLLAQLLKPLQ